MVGPQVISRILNSPDFEAFGSTRPRGQDSAARAMAAPARLQDRARVQSARRRASGRSAATCRMVDLVVARPDLLPAPRQRRPAVDAPGTRRGNANSPEPMWRDFAFNRQFHQPGRLAVERRRRRTRLDAGARLSLRRRRRAVRRRSRAADRRPDDREAARLPAVRAARALVRATAGGGLRRIELPSGGAIYVAAAENEQIASRDRPIGISVPLGRPLGDIVGPQAFACRPDRPDADEIPPLRLGGAPRHRAAARRHHPRAGVLQLPRALAAHAARRSELCDERQLLRRRARRATTPAADRGAGGGASVCVDLTPALGAAWTIRAACAPTG